MAITCCKNCVPPQRHPGCHGTCEQYLKEKAEYEKQKEYAKAHKTVMLTNYDSMRLPMPVLNAIRDVAEIKA